MNEMNDVLRLINIEINKKKSLYKRGDFLLKCIRRMCVYNECLRLDEIEENEKDISIEKLIQNERIFDISSTQQQININDKIINLIDMIFQKIIEEDKKRGYEKVLLIKKVYFSDKMHENRYIAKSLKMCLRTFLYKKESAVCSFYEQILKIEKDRDVTLLSLKQDNKKEITESYLSDEENK